MQENNSSLKTNLKLRLTVAEFETLHDTLGVSKARLSRLLDKPQSATLSEIKKIASIFGCTIPKAVNEYGLGLNLKISDFAGIAKVEINEID